MHSWLSASHGSVAEMSTGFVNGIPDLGAVHKGDAHRQTSCSVNSFFRFLCCVAPRDCGVIDVVDFRLAAVIRVMSKDRRLDQIPALTWKLVLGSRHDIEVMDDNAKAICARVG